MHYLMSNGIRLAYQTAGDPKHPPLLLIAGLGMQLVLWPDDLVEELVELGFYVIRYDNRDCGLSDKFSQAGVPNVALTFLKHLVRWPIRSAYRLDDMAADAMGVLRALGVNKAHVVGVSMGGMIAQILAARHPGRVLSLTSISSTSGRRGLPWPTRKARAMLMRRPPDLSDFDSVVVHGTEVLRAIGSPAYPTSDKQLRAIIGASVRRNVCPDGLARQLVALMASGDRVELLKSIRVPTLVIHGAADPLVPVAAGIDTARLVPDARLAVIEGMGHDLPSQLVERIAALIDAHAHGKIVPDSTARLFERQ